MCLENEAIFPDIGIMEQHSIFIFIFNTTAKFEILTIAHISFVIKAIMKKLAFG